MSFRREAAAQTLVRAAAALHAHWDAVPLDVQEQIKALIDEYGHEIYKKNRANRAISIVRLLDRLAELPGLPQPVLDALGEGTGESGFGYVPISDEQRDEVLSALVQVFDARLYDHPHALAEALRREIDRRVAHELDPGTRIAWEQFDADFRFGGSAYEFLEGVAALLGGRYAFVRDAISAGKSWAAVPTNRAERPSGGGSKGVEETTGEPTFARPQPTPGPPDRTVPPAARVVQRSANVYFPKTVQRAQKMIPLIVHVARGQAEGTVSIVEGSSAIAVSVGDLKIFVLTADFTVERAIGGREIPDVDHGRIVRIDPEIDSEPVVFFLSPASTGEKRISIEFKQFGKRIGSLVFGVSVVEEAAPAAALANAVDNDSPFPIATRAVTGVEEVEVPDLDLRVGRQGNTLTFALSSADGKYDEKKLGQKVLQIDPAPFFADIAQQLSDLAAKRPEQRTSEDRELPSLLGAQLWDQLMSDELRQAYKDDLRVNHRGQSLKITTDEPWIPWEMLRPVELEGGSFLVDDPPLCEMFRVTRWLDGRGAPDEVRVKRGIIVAPAEETLPSVAAELAYFSSLSWFVPARTKEEVSSELRDGVGELFHFSCHGGVDPGDAWLKLGEEYLKSKSILYGREYNVSSAFIFLNACEAGQAKLEITGLDGWALAFLRRNASVFIGSLWSINDRLASQFARSFYDCLFGLSGQKPQPIGAAFQVARQAIKAEDPDNPTWLAYVLYGDPNGRVYVDR